MKGHFDFKNLVTSIQHVHSELSANATRAINVSLTLRNCHRRQLYDYLKFYRAYPEIVSTVSAQLTIPAEKLINHLSYSMFKILVELDDDIKRAFYELECIKGNWTVRELSR